MYDFKPILNWKLLAGSHEFPGPDGGTCVNEAAIVAAGFAYREVGSVEDCPPCFSRPLAAYALSLNDRIDDDDLRHALLMPFVSRLAGSADCDEVENRRAAHILLATVRRVLPPALDFRGLFHVAALCRDARSVEEARAAMIVAVEVIEKLAPPDQDSWRLFDDPLTLMADALRDLLLDEVWGKSQPMLRAGDLPHYAGAILDGRRARGGRKSCFTIAAAMLAEALEIGSHVEPDRAPVVARRLESAKRHAGTRKAPVLAPAA
jgi:hypothetical protein